MLQKGTATSSPTPHWNYWLLAFLRRSSLVLVLVWRLLQHLPAFPPDTAPSLLKSLLHTTFLRLGMLPKLSWAPAESTCLNTSSSSLMLSFCWEILGFVFPTLCSSGLAPCLTSVWKRFVLNEVSLEGQNAMDTMHEPPFLSSTAWWTHFCGTHCQTAHTLHLNNQSPALALC